MARSKRRRDWEATRGAVAAGVRAHPDWADTTRPVIDRLAAWLVAVGAWPISEETALGLVGSGKAVYERLREGIVMDEDLFAAAERYQDVIDWLQAVSVAHHEALERVQGREVVNDLTRAEEEATRIVLDALAVVEMPVLTRPFVGRPEFHLMRMDTWCPDCRECFARAIEERMEYHLNREAMASSTVGDLHGAIIDVLRGRDSA